MANTGSGNNYLQLEKQVHFDDNVLPTNRSSNGLRPWLYKTFKTANSHLVYRYRLVHIHISVDQKNGYSQSFKHFETIYSFKSHLMNSLFQAEWFNTSNLLIAMSKIRIFFVGNQDVDLGDEIREKNG